MNASERVDRPVADYPDWRGATTARLRQLIRESAPEVQEDWKSGTAVRSHAGLTCVVDAFAGQVKLNVFQGAALEDPDGLFNAGLAARKSRPIDMHERDRVDDVAPRTLMRAPVQRNVEKK